MVADQNQDHPQKPPEEQPQPGFLPSSDDLLAPSPVEALTSWFTPRRIISWALVLAILGSGWLCFFGPGAPLLENYLEERAEVKPTKTPPFTPSSTPPSSPTPIPATATPGKTPAASTQPAALLPNQTPENLAPTNTLPAEAVSLATDTLAPLYPAPTLTESPTPTFTATRTPTATTTPTTAVANCTTALQVTLADVGRTMCVTGNVLRTDDKGTYFLILLEDPAKAFFFVSYDRKWENLKKGECVFATGEIKALGSVPIMEIGYVPPLEYCSP